MFKAFAPVCTAMGIGLATWGGLASAGDPDGGAIPPGKPVRSTVDTAAAGRRPLAVRIAMADKLKSGEPKVVEPAVGSPSSTAETPEAPPSGTSSGEGASDAGSFVPGSSAAASSPEHREQGVPHRDRLLGRVRERIAALAESPTPAGPSPAGTASAAVQKGPESVAARPNSRPNVPRLRIECEESTIESRRGDTVTWRVKVRNAGTVAHGVLVTLYFAEGIEPTTAGGQAHKISAGEVRFSPVETLGPHDAIELQVTGKAVQAGAVAYRVEVGCREVPGNVAHEAVVLVRPIAGN